MTSEFRALQLEVADLREEVEDLRAEIVRLRRALTDLRTGGAQPAIRESDLESVGSYSFVSERDSRAGFVGASGAYSSASPTPAPTSLRAPTASPTPSSETGSARCPLTWNKQEDIADQIGGFIARAVAGHNRGNSGRERNPLASRLWIVVRDYEGQIYSPVKVVRSWSSAKVLVKRGSTCGDAIFIGLPSEREGRRAIAIAGLLWPEVIEP